MEKRFRAGRRPSRCGGVGAERKEGKGGKGRGRRGGRVWGRADIIDVTNLQTKRSYLPVICSLVNPSCDDVDFGVVLGGCRC